MQEPTDLEFQEATGLIEGRLRPEVRQALAGKDLAEALLSHLRGRRGPRPPFGAQELPRIAALAAKWDPAEHAWEKKIADHAVEGRMLAASNPYCDRFVQVDRQTFDFSRYDHPDPQSIHGLGRLRWMPCLARMYWWSGGDERYYRSLMEHWDFFIEKVPLPGEEFYRGIHAIGAVGMAPPFGELDTFIRLANWWRAYWPALHAAPMTPRRNAVLLARCLRMFDLVAARGIKRHEHNFTSMQMEALYLWAVSLPEFVGMDVWQHASRNIMESSLDRAVFRDGVQWEKSAGYHIGCIRWYGTSYLAGQMIGRPWAQPYGERLRLMGEFLDAVVTPDGNCPLLSDSDRDRTWTGGLSLLRCIFPDMKFRRPVAPSYFSLWASGGMEWDPAATIADKARVAVFPEGGVGVARNPDARAGSMVILDNGPTSAGHAHKNNLTIHYDARLKPVVVDPGRWIYAPDDDRVWVTRCQSHNTVYIEDAPILAGRRITQESFQIIPSPRDPRLGEMQAVQRDGLAVMASSFQGHADDAHAIVRRTVVFPLEGQATWLAVVDRIAGSGEHHWTNSWLLSATRPVIPVQGGFRAVLDSGLTLLLAVASDMPMELRDDAMFWCPVYAEKALARWLRLSGRCVRADRAFLFVPTDLPELPMPGIELTPAGLSLSLPGRRLLVPLGE